MTDTPPVARPHARPSRTALFILLSALLLGLILTGLAVGASVRTSLLPPTPTPQIEGITAFLDEEPLPDFTLINIEGEPTNLSDFAGRYVVLFFGFTHCPDFCPLTLSDYKIVKDELDDAASEVAFVFVSVDGERDTPEALGRYVTRFDPSFVGLTGDSEAVRALGTPYGLFFELNKESPDDTEYTVDHSTLTYIIDPERQLHSVVSYGTPPVTIAAYLRVLIETP
ncbi:MAG: SCO family protein [Chloroflexota bacterium]|nr:SCO family protein [Chloroflexota bacterium]